LAKRRVLLVDDEVTVLLTLKAVLEISGFDVDTAASAREARSRIKLREYQMVITDMRMESDAAGREVIQAARTAPYHPAVALLTAFPDDDWADIGADKMLVKPMQTAILIRQIEKMMDVHAAKLRQQRRRPVPERRDPHQGNSREEEVRSQAPRHQEVAL
jgi:DNA-binding response OmpR family regulator